MHCKLPRTHQEITTAPEQQPAFARERSASPTVGTRVTLSRVMIRSARASDAEAICAVHHASIRALCSAAYTEQQLGAWLACLEPPVYRALLSTRRMIVFEQDGGLLGFGAHDPALGFVHATYVSPTTARQGVGTSLLRDMEIYTEASVLQLHATLNAVAFYEARGYRRGELASNRLPSGVELPCVCMSKPLAPRGHGAPAPDGVR
jgi:GNAT superfamily N-acetyltransferase